ncbi:MAG: nucleotidyltransferase domain-containing protein [Methanomassiliicoccaceae archaeon]|nr:nucleotidyltransferase domain-containing protein [Methanomassiliicoccaceae archaeon]
MDAYKEISFEDLRNIVAPIAIEHGIIRVYLFGSRARGDNGKDSDFDFCIVVPETYDLFDIGGFLYDLKEALGTKVDIVCEDNAMKRPSLMEEILHDRKIVFEA